METKPKKIPLPYGLDPTDLHKFEGYGIDWIPDYEETDEIEEEIETFRNYG